MITVFGVHTKDDELALKNLKWWNELGGCLNHEVLFIYDTRVNPDLIDKIKRELTLCFRKLYVLQSNANIDGWPQGANYFFRMCVGWLAQRTEYKYFLWMEPDTIPLVEGWMDKLETDHVHSGKPFSGDRVEFKDVPLHMSGIGIYENPIYNQAGEAFRAFDVAWDIAAAGQIVPLANWTKLVQHEWKHPKFTSIDELRTIRPEAVVFHSSKDGSLIDFLIQKRGGKLASGDIRPVEPPVKEPVIVAGSPATPSADIFIRTYPGDFQWLKYCLKSINKFVTGFQNIWIMCPGENLDTSGLELEKVKPPPIWRVVSDEHEDGYMAQQITKLYADMLTVLHEPSEFILMVDSDVIFNRPVTPDFFLKDGKAIWYYTPYEQAGDAYCWKAVTEKFLGGRSLRYEFMRRAPQMIPRWLLPDLREFCYNTHRMTVSTYINMQPKREFSEFNALGGYAYEFVRDKIHWVNTNDEVRPQVCCRQFHSWSGLTDIVQAEIDTILGEPFPSGLGETIKAGVVPPPEPAPATAGELVRALKAIADTNQNKRNDVLKLLRQHGLRIAPPKVKKVAARQNAKEVAPV